MLLLYHELYRIESAKIHDSMLSGTLSKSLITITGEVIIP